VDPKKNRHPAPRRRPGSNNPSASPDMRPPKRSDVEDDQKPGRSIVDIAELPQEAPFSPPAGTTKQRRSRTPAGRSAAFLNNRLGDPPGEGAPPSPGGAPSPGGGAQAFAGAGETRTATQRDRDRLLYAPELRRLAAVTQVVSAVEGHVFHNRLTHTLKVAQIARRLAERFNAPGHAVPGIYGQIDCEAVEAAALAHDLGHPPFGHIAEEELDSLVLDAGSRDGYEGNAQSFRIVCTLAARRGDEVGLQLTRLTLNAMLKYPWPRGEEGKKHKKWGYYTTERQAFEFARLQFPFGEQTPSPEAYLMTLADDITYSVHDMLDFFQAGLVPLDRLTSQSDPRELELFLDQTKQRARPDSEIGKKSHEELRAAFEAVLEVIEAPEPYNGSRRHQGLVQKTTSQLITRFVNAVAIHPNPEQGGKSFYVPGPPDLELDLLQQLTWHYVILRPSLASLQHGQRGMIRKLFEVFLEAANGKKTIDWAILPRSANEEMARLHIRYGYGIPAEERIRVAADAIAGMTEHQVIHLYQRLTGTGPGSVLDRIIV